MTEHEAWLKAESDYGPKGYCRIGICEWINEQEIWHDDIDAAVADAMRDKIGIFAPPAGYGAFRWPREDRAARAAFCRAMAELTKPVAVKT